ncbi:MAG: cytochrome c biogenesis protein CcsA [Deinococcales bacterium]
MSISKHTQQPLWLKAFGLINLILLGIGAYLAFIVSPADKTQGELVRIMYAHVSVAWICFVAVIIGAVAGAIFLWNSSRLSDVVAVASAELGLFYATLTVLSGMTWGKPTWGAWWVWDAKLTTTALMCFLLVGYFIIRAMIDDPLRRGRISAVIGLIILANVPIIYFASEWWNTLHQPLSLQIGEKPRMDPIMVKILLYNVGVAALIYGYFMTVRIRLGRLGVRQEIRMQEPARKSEAIHV